MNLNFRLAVQQDLPEVWQMFVDAIDLMNSQGIPQWDEIYPNHQTISDDIQKQQMYLLIQDEVIVSAVVLNEEQDQSYQTADWKHADGKIAVIHRLCVKTSTQGKSYGKKTVQLAEQELFRLGYDSVRLDAVSFNPFALKLYDSLGYQKTGEAFYRKGKFYLFEKPLLHRD